MKPGDLVQRAGGTDPSVFLVIGVSYASGEPKVQLCNVPKSNPKRTRQPGPWRWRKASLFKIVGTDPDWLAIYEVMES